MGENLDFRYEDALAATAGEQMRGPLRILIVEDEQMLALDARAKLMRLGYEVCAVVSTGGDAIDQAERLLPSVVVMDIRLAGEMDGIAAGAIIRKRLQIPVVYLTALADENTLKAVKESSDPFGYLLKPLQERELRITLEMALYRHQTDRQLREAKRRLEVHTRRQAVVAQIGLEALSGMPIAELMQRAADLTGDVMNADFCAVTRYMEHENSLVLTAGVGWGPGEVGSVRMEVNGTQYGHALGSIAPVVVETAESSDEELPAHIADHGVASGVALGIGETHPWGVIGVHTRERRWFTDEDMHFLQSLVHVLTAAVERERREALIKDLATPMLPIGDGIVLAPLVGSLDQSRSNMLTGNLLLAVRVHRARVVLLDLTGLRLPTPELLAQLAESAEAARLMGCEVIVSGVSPAVAETIVSCRIDFSSFRTARDLSGGIELATGLAKKGGLA